MHKLFCLLFLTGLSGCNIYSSEFDCPYGQGMGCASLSTVNKTIDTQSMDRKSDLQGIGGLKEKKSALIYFGKNKMSKMVNFEKSDI